MADHGDSILRLAGLKDIIRWQPLQAEVVQPRQLPDGLLEILFQGRIETDLVILEMATVAEPRLIEQILRDLTLVYLDRRILPEVFVLILSQGGSRTENTLTMASRLGLTQWSVRWRVVELWNVSAADLLAANDVGLIPWVPLTRLDERPENVLAECRRRIDSQATAEECENMLAVTRVLASLRYNDPQILSIFGGKETMLEFPAIQELVAEARHRDIIKALELRFGAVPQEIVSEVQAIRDAKKIDELFDHAITCADLDAFKSHLR